MKKVIAVINGPNLNMLGKREPHIYGFETLTEIENNLNELKQKLDIDLLFYQSNHEGNLVDFIQENSNRLSGIIINPAAFTKTGYSILEAMTATNIPFVEVHLSNLTTRGGWHAESVFTGSSKGFIMGFRGYGYELALNALYKYIKEN